MIKVLIADDHPIFREGLKKILFSSQDKAMSGIIVDEARNGQEVLGMVVRNRYDVVILDVNMPGRNGLEILEQLKAENPELRVLILSMYSEELYAVRAIKAGAAGYLNKNGAAMELVEALKKVISGNMYISPAVAEQLAVELKSDLEKPLHELLSAREYQVMCMIAAGKSIKSIADELAISTSAVSTHRHRLLKKMNMKNSAELIRYSVKQGLVD